MTTKPERCCAEGCGRPTQSHNVAVDVSEHDAVGLPTLAGVVCHRCWVDGPDGAEPIEERLDDHDRLYEALDTGEMVAVGTPVGELVE